MLPIFLIFQNFVTSEKKMDIWYVTTVNNFANHLINDTSTPQKNYRIE